MTTPPTLTDAAVRFLAGRAVHVRASRRHGCCGGAASVPVAEPGAPATTTDAERFEVSGTHVYIDRRLSPPEGRWTIDVEGFARWRRLVVLGLDLAPVIDGPASTASPSSTANTGNTGSRP